MIVMKEELGAYEGFLSDLATSIGNTVRSSWEAISKVATEAYMEKIRSKILREGQKYGVVYYDPSTGRYVAKAQAPAPPPKPAPTMNYMWIAAIGVAGLAIVVLLLKRRG